MSLFKKNLLLTTIIIVLSLVFLGFSTVFLVSSYWEQKEQELLKTTVTETSALLSSLADREKTSFITPSIALEAYDFISVLSKSSHADVYLIDEKGNILLKLDDLIAKYKKVISLTQDIVNLSLRAPTRIKSSLNGTYDNNLFVYSVPIVSSSQEDSANKNIGAVIAVSDLARVKSFKIEIIGIIAIVGIVVFFFSLGITLVFSYNLSKPIKAICFAVKKIGAGDYSYRIYEKINPSGSEIFTLSHEINQMADSLSRMEMMSRSFIANVSHELKTPMTSIQGFIQGILDGTIPKEKEKHYLKIVLSEVKRLSRLVYTMLEMTKLDNDEIKLNLGTCELKQILINVLLSFEKEIFDRKIEVVGADTLEDTIIFADSDFIYQAIYNIIENAVKFTPEEGYIRVNLIENDKCAYLTIENSGEGIDDSDIHHIFERFYKSDKSRSEDIKGLGLGLYLVKMIMKLHGGNISLQSEKDQYTRFTLRIPINCEQNSINKKAESDEKEKQIIDL